MNGTVPDDGRRTLLARLAALSSLVPDFDVDVDGLDLDIWSDGDSGGGEDGDGEDVGDSDGEDVDENRVEDHDQGGNENRDDGREEHRGGDRSDCHTRTEGNTLYGSGDDGDARSIQTAVVDRIEDGTAVVLFEAAGYQRTVSAGVLPEAAREEGAVLRVPEGEALALATVDRTATQERRESAQGRVDDLAERPDGP